MANAPFRTDPRLLTTEDWDALQTIERARIARGLPGIGEEVRGLVARLTPSLVEIPPGSHLIDLDATPVVPEGWSIAPESEQLHSRVRGQVVWDPKRVGLYLEPAQERLRGGELKKRLECRPIYGVQMGDFLVAHPELIPKEWEKNIFVHFWTVFYGWDGRPLVRDLYCDDGVWLLSHRDLSVTWTKAYYAAVCTNA